MALPLLVACTAVPAAKPQGTLVLDAAAPFIRVTVAGVPVRLRVDPGQWAAVELKGDVADRLAVHWEGGEDAEVGRTLLPGRVAAATLALGPGKPRAVAVVSHERALAEDADGVIGPDLLPYAEVRWLRAGAAATGTRTLPLDWSGARGLEGSEPALPAGLKLHFTLLQSASAATAAGGALIAASCGGRFAGPPADVPAAFGLTRPARPLACAGAFVAAGFRFETIPVRIADFRGQGRLPNDPALPSDITVSRRVTPQHGEAWLAIGTDRLARCAEIAYFATPRSLRLHCAFDS